MTFNLDSTINFECTKCGECCSSSPFVNLYDMFMLSKEFIFQAYHHGVLSFTKKPIDEKLTNHLKLLANTMVLPEMDAVLFYYINFTTLELNSYNKCSKLKDNLCSIYGFRPTMCKILPFSIHSSEDEQWKNINFFKNKVDNENWKCDFSKNIIYDKGIIKDSKTSNLYYNELKITQEFTNSYVDYIKTNNQNYYYTHFKNMINSALKKQNLYSDLLLTLKISLEQGVVSQDEIFQFIENQIIKIDNELERAKSLKNKKDLKVSRIYKRQRDLYAKSLKNKTFEMEDELYE